MAVSENDQGWDVFTLDYNVDGPIGTVNWFTFPCMMYKIVIANFNSQILEPSRQIYQTIFFSLWKAKRMETILSAIWKQQITSAKIFRKMPEIVPIQNHIHLITSSMVNLVHQMQYYFLFEVIECSWDIFTKQLSQASSLDDIITSHNNFINAVKRGTLLDEQSQVINSKSFFNLMTYIGWQKFHFIPNFLRENIWILSILIIEFPLIFCTPSDAVIGFVAQCK